MFLKRYIINNILLKDVINKSFLIMIVVNLLMVSCYNSYSYKNNANKTVNKNKIKKFKIEIIQPFGDSQSADSAFIAAIEKAKFEAIEKAGTYIESETRIHNGSITKSDIIAIAAGIVNFNDITKKPCLIGTTGYCVKVKVEIQVDTSILHDKVNMFLSNNALLKQYKLKNQELKRILRKYEELEKINEELLKNTINTEVQKKNFSKIL